MMYFLIIEVYLWYFMKKKKMNYSHLSSRLFFCIVFISFAVIIQSCTTTSKGEKHRLEMANMAKENPQCCVEKVYLGAVIKFNKTKELIITSVVKDSPADKAGLLPGDIVLKIDNENVKDKYHAFVLYDSKYPNDMISLTVKRKGEIVTNNFQLSSLYFLNVQYDLLELIYKDVPVRLAIIFGNIDYGHPYIKDLFEKHQSYHVASLESAYLSAFKNQDNFAIINRQKTDAVLNELKFQASGLVDNKSREKLGRMLGATHLLVMDISSKRSYDNKVEYLYVLRLMEVLTGKTLSISTITYKPEKPVDLVKIDFLDYREKMKKISVLEEEAIAAYSSVTGNNYKDDTAFHNALVNVVIPKYQVCIQHLMAISPTTAEVLNVHQLFIEGANLQLQAFQIHKSAVEQQDKILINKGNQLLKLGNQKVQESQAEAKKIINR